MDDVVTTATRQYEFAFRTREELDMEDLVRRFWTVAEILGAEKWRNTNRHIAGCTEDDLRGLALHTLALWAWEFPDWLKRNDVDPTNTYGLFKVMLKRKFNWDYSQYLLEQQRAGMTAGDFTGDDGEELDITVVTALRNHQPISELHQQLAQHVGTLPLLEQLVLALRFYEELNYRQIGEAIGMTQSGVRLVLDRTVNRVLVRAIRHTVMTTIPKPLPARGIQAWTGQVAAEVWTQDNYGVEPAVYVKYIAVHYAADVSYLVDMIRHSNGDVPRIFSRLTGRGKLSIEQIAEIDDALADGETQRSIAARYGVTQGAISLIARREAR